MSSHTFAHALHGPWVVFQAASCDFSQRGLIPGINFLPLIPANFLLHFICAERSFKISYPSSLLAVETMFPGDRLVKIVRYYGGFRMLAVSGAWCLSRWLSFLEPHLLKMLLLWELWRSQMSLPEKWQTSCFDKLLRSYLELAKNHCFICWSDSLFLWRKTMRVFFQLTEGFSGTLWALNVSPYVCCGRVTDVSCSLIFVIFICFVALTVWLYADCNDW